MKNWTDNTAIHSAGRCFYREPKGEVDARGLLQLAIAIIYSDKILISDYESLGVAKRTESICTDIYGPASAQSIDENQSYFEVLEATGDLPIKFQSHEPDEYGALCDKVALEILQGECSGESLFDRIGSTSNLLTTLPDLTREERNTLKELAALLTQDISEESITDLVDKSLKTFSAGGAIYILGTNRELLSLVKHKLKERKLRETELINIVSNTRLGLNSVFAREHHSFYMPAVARAKKESEISDQFIKNISKLIQNGAQLLVPTSIPYPDLTDSLLLLSEGSPEKLMYHAMRLRVKTADMRMKMRDLAIDSESNYEEISKYNSFVSKLSRNIQWELAPETSPSLLKAIIGLRSWVRDPAKNIEEIEDVYMFLKNRAYVGSFTELARVSSVGSTEKAKHYFKLLSIPSKRIITTVRL